jgi:hypothetical protein
MSRKQRDVLTGGTGDVNPQQMTVSVTQTGSDVYTYAQIPNPVPRYPGANNKAIVMEVLNVLWFNPNAPSAAASSVITGTLATRVFANNGATVTPATAFAEPSVFSIYNERTLFATAVGFQAFSAEAFFHDLSDAAGHGHLVATDNIYISVASTGVSAANQLMAKITYRMKEIGLAEYVGIVQSQQ